MNTQQWVEEETRFICTYVSSVLRFHRDSISGSRWTRWLLSSLRPAGGQGRAPQRAWARGMVLRTATFLLELRMTFHRLLPADRSFQSTSPVEGRPPERPWVAPPHRHVRQLQAPLPSSATTQVVASPQKPSIQQPKSPGACSRTQASEPLPLPHGSHTLSTTRDCTERGARPHLCVWTHVIFTSSCPVSFVYASSPHHNHKHT